MHDDNALQTEAIGWMLRAPSASGGKVHVTIIVDYFSIVGWGAEHQRLPYSSRQWKVMRHGSAAAARG